MRKIGIIVALAALVVGALALAATGAQGQSTETVVCETVTITPAVPGTTVTTWENWTGAPPDGTPALDAPEWHVVPGLDAPPEGEAFEDVQPNVPFEVPSKNEHAVSAWFLLRQIVTEGTPAVTEERCTTISTTPPTTTTKPPVTTTEPPVTTTEPPKPEEPTGEPPKPEEPTGVPPEKPEKPEKPEVIKPEEPTGLAFTGPEGAVPLGALALMLLTGGTGLMWAGNRRRKD